MGVRAGHTGIVFGAGVNEPEVLGRLVHRVTLAPHVQRVVLHRALGMHGTIDGVVEAGNGHHAAAHDRQLTDLEGARREVRGGMRGAVGHALDGVRGVRAAGVSPELDGVLDLVLPRPIGVEGVLLVHSVPECADGHHAGLLGSRDVVQDVALLLVLPRPIQVEGVLLVHFIPEDAHGLHPAVRIPIGVELHVILHFILPCWREVQGVLVIDRVPEHIDSDRELHACGVASCPNVSLLLDLKERHHVVVCPCPA
mmetsp:Transcript_90541/g.251734  ORF Transcript_90541/g.251734 Transcript_90541/m.251734 type:complete len:254 (-) Transcript_90541:134-895(-)